MSYSCGTNGMAALGIPDTAPAFTCDRCSSTHRIEKGKPPPVWFLEGKAPRRWWKRTFSIQVDADYSQVVRVDLCERCKPCG